ncbi:MAG: leucine-rich repeat domain-containing protein, partial [Myxococcota bacterium]|nr:leucine-rich repeat domain-containing protein [Myxococcota bacterium]
MIFTLLQACMLQPSVETKESLFKLLCVKPEFEQQALLIEALSDRLGSQDCHDLYQHLSNNKTLDLGNHPIDFQDLTPISEFNHIEELYLSDSLISDLTPIKEFTNLRVLHLDHCDLEDISPLSKLTNLEDLLLDYTRVADISVLQSATKLKRVGLRKTQITSIDSLSSMTQLRSLEISGTEVSTLGPLSSLRELKVLSVRDTKISDLQPLSGHQNLFFVDVQQTDVKDLSPLQNLEALKVLDISKTQVSDLSSLAKSANSMIELRVHDTPIEKTACSQFSDTIRGCKQVSEKNTFLRLCTYPQDFPFLTQVSLVSLQQELGTEDCQTMLSTLTESDSFTAANPFPDPTVFSLFPNLRTVNIPIEPVNYKRCTLKEQSPAVQTVCDQKKQSMDAAATASEAAFLSICANPPETVLPLILQLQAKSEVSDCNKIWNWVRNREKLSLTEADLTDVSEIGRAHVGKEC